MAWMAVNPRLDAVRGALVYLGEADQLARGVAGSASSWALSEQFVPYDTNFFGGRGSRDPPSAKAVPLIVPAWGWALVAAIALGVPSGFLLPDLWLIGAALGALLGLYGRYALTLSLAEQLRRPSEESVEAIHRALGEAARFMHEAGVQWQGGDPSVADSPWKMRAQIQATLKVLHDAEVQALASG